MHSTLQLGHLRRILGSISVSGQLRTYPSPNPTSYNKLVSYCYCWVRGGVGAQLPRYWHWSEYCSRTSLSKQFISFTKEWPSQPVLTGEKHVTIFSTGQQWCSIHSAHSCTAICRSRCGTILRYNTATAATGTGTPASVNWRPDTEQWHRTQEITCY